MSDLIPALLRRLDTAGQVVGFICSMTLPVVVPVFVWMGK